jgi:hypothetical protein
MVVLLGSTSTAILTQPQQVREVVALAVDVREDSIKI